MGWEWHNSNGVSFLTIPEWEENGIRMGFSSRDGGVSHVPYTSLNLGLHVGDNAQAVVINRERWLRGLDSTLDKVVIGQQVHGINVEWVTEALAGRGAKDMGSAIAGTDGLITKTGVGLMAFFADCVPLFFYHPRLKAVAIAHAGWKGTLGRIAKEVIKCFEQVGGHPEDTWVAIGPSIGPCCYEVDSRVMELFEASFKDCPFLVRTRPGYGILDLWKANLSIVLEAGVHPHNIWSANLCTACHPELFYSHRRDGALTGRMGGFIRLDL